MTRNPIIIIGAGGHAKSVLAALIRAQLPVAGLTDADPALRGATVLGHPVMGDDRILAAEDPERIDLVNGVGWIGKDNVRRIVQEKLMAQGWRFVSVIDPWAMIGPEVRIAAGAQILAGAVVQPQCRIGMGTIINTRAVVDHDCIIGDFSHIATGAALCGNVSVGDQSLIGAGATIRQGITVADCALVGAGAAVVRNVGIGEKVLGVPARPVTGS